MFIGGERMGYQESSSVRGGSADDDSSVDYGPDLEKNGKLG